MIFLLLFISNLFAQDTLSYGYNIDRYSPVVIYQNDSNGTMNSMNSPSNDRSRLEDLVKNQEREQKDFINRFIEKENAKMRNAEVQVKKDLVSKILQNSNFSSNLNNKSVDQFRMYADSSESLKAKIDKYNYYTNPKIGRYTDAATLGESISYSNISGGFPQGFNDNGIFVPEKINAEIPKGVFSNFKPSQEFNSPQGQMVRRMANEYQGYWARSSMFIARSYAKSSQFYLGASYVKLADQEFKSNPVLAVAYLKLSKDILDFSRGITNGVVKSVTDLIKAAPALAGALKNYSLAVAGDPSYLVSSLYSFVMATPKLGAALVSGLIEKLDILENGNAYQRGQVLGEHALDILSLFAGGETLIVKEGVSVVTKEIAEGIATNPNLQKIIAKEIIPAVEEAAEMSGSLKNLSKEEYLKALEIKLALKESGAITASADSVTITETVSTRTGTIELSHNVLNKELHNVEILAAEEANTILKDVYRLPPYMPSTRVYQFLIDKPIIGKFVRVYADEGKMVGPWIVEKTSIEGLSPAQIMDKLSLKYPPNYIVDVEIPAGTYIRKGIPNTLFGSSGKQFVIQYEIATEKLNGVNIGSMFKTARKLKD